jgi:NAD(P)-dependent dehydrogenase (short-subunit alcohol dehydrogenase family)
LLDVDEAAGRHLAKRINGIEFVPCDLRDTAALLTAARSAQATLGGVDILLNNAGSDDRHALDDITPEYWDERIATNLRHLFFAAQAVVPAMRAAGGGAIVNFGSISWHLGLSSLLVYQTAKAGIEGLTRSLARELGRDNIRVTTIVPGGVQTPRQAKWYTPGEEEEMVTAQCLNGRIQPADVAALALFLASDDGRMCTGHEYFVDAGWR